MVNWDYWTDQDEIEDTEDDEGLTIYEEIELTEATAERENNY